MMQGSGQTINDRINAARYALAGQGLARVVCKATTEEMIAPKRKHIDCEYYLPFFWIVKVQLILSSGAILPISIWNLIQ